MKSIKIEFLKERGKKDKYQILLYAPWKKKMQKYSIFADFLFVIATFVLF